MICAVEWKRLFCALNSFKNRLYTETLKYSLLLTV